MLMVVEPVDAEHRRQVFDPDPTGGCVTRMRARMGDNFFMFSARAYGDVCVTGNLIISIGGFRTYGFGLVTGCANFV